jgi:hypothetical protein
MIKTTKPVRYLMAIAALVVLAVITSLILRVKHNSEIESVTDGINRTPYSLDLDISGRQ